MTPDGIDRGQLLHILGIVHDQVATALWLSLGMVLSVAAVVCAALSWRRPCLAFGLLYCVTLCFVHNGHAQTLGSGGRRGRPDRAVLAAKREPVAMMHFLEPSADVPWLAELKECGLLTPDVIERIDAAMGRPESGTLNDFLLAGSDWLPWKDWVSWLIARHGCHRYGTPCWEPEAARWAAAGPPSDGNFPYLRCPDGQLLVAVLRPDLREASERRLAPERCLWEAATPVEIRALREHWRKASSDHL